MWKYSNTSTRPHQKIKITFKEKGIVTENFKMMFAKEFSRNHKALDICPLL